MKEHAKCVCIIQARMGSSRLPGKVLADICGQPMMAWVASRAARSRYISEIMVATTLNPADDPIEKFCRKAAISCFRGSEFDVLDRYYQAAKACHATLVVRVTADCPLIDAGLIDQVIDALSAEGADFAANRLPPPYQRTYPIGLDVEVVTFVALESAWKKAERTYEREHVMPYIYDPQNNFKVVIIDAEQDDGRQRWTVDTPQDLEFIRRVADEFSCRMDFTWQEVLEMLENRPDLLSINMDVPHKSYNDVDDRANLSQEE